ncbi:IscS subfamily cysteine desulfurase [Burkholderia multivorans]|nr:IscS subfamily cysteine desulfurase [Burkholderia multivorans]
MSDSTPFHYLDYAATTPADPRVIEAMTTCLGFDGIFGNPASSSHIAGRLARQKVEHAREQVAALIGAHADEIVWTSGATESNNLALKGYADTATERRHLITSRIEHKAILDTMANLSKRGMTVTWLSPTANGEITADAVAAAIGPDTGLVSLMLVNNELGTLTDVGAIARIVHAAGALLHVDAAQALGKTPIDVHALGIDMMSMSAHKVYGPKGIGALYVRRKPRVRIEAQMHGGGHERGMRSGTLPTHQIVGMGEAFRIAREEMATENERIRMLRDKLLRGLSRIEETYVNGDMEHRIPHNLNISFNFVEGESLIMAIKDVAVSSGSACTSASLEPSYVLRALGRNDELAHSSIRFTVGRFTTEQEVDYVIELLNSKIAKLRELSPLWEMHQEGIDLSTIEWAAH